MTGAASGIVACPPMALPALAQARLRRIAIVVLRAPGPDEESSLPRTALAALAELGWVDGRTASIEVASAQGVLARLPGIARDVVAKRPDVILAGGGTVAAELVALTRDIPIVMAVSSFDPVERGWASSYGRPGGNVTGLTFAADEAIEKQFEYLKEAAPFVRHVGVLRTRQNAATRMIVDRTQAAAQSLGLTISVQEIDGPTGATAAVDGLKADGADALMPLVDPVMDSLRRPIAAAAIRHRMPSVAQLVWYATDGFLLAYAADLTALHRRGAAYANRILRGERAGELPIERPTQFSLTLNLRTARAIGLDLPPSLLLQADTVIE